MEMSKNASPLTPGDFNVEQLGEARFENPIRAYYRLHGGPCRFIDDDRRVHYRVEVDRDERDDASPLLFEKAGPRASLFFQPEKVHAAIVTCGGLCPGLNDVIRSIVNQLYYHYGVRRISGVPYGYRGLNPASRTKLMELSPQAVLDVHHEAGTILGSSRGEQPTDLVVDTLQKTGINILFCIGGDGTQRGARDIAEEAARRRYALSVVGVPKTIDNDLAFVYKTFGFETAVQTAVAAIHGAHTEARSYLNGVGLVKLMGRDSGFIAAYATLASGDVNYLLVPEVPFALEGKHGLIEHLHRRLAARRHAVIVVAEGAGQHLFEDADDPATHPDGRPRNRVYQDIGALLIDRLQTTFQERGNPIALKYIDPSYMIRNTPANASDSIYCLNLGHNAVHAAMAGKTNMMVGLWHNVFVHVPIGLTTRYRKRINPESALWRSVLEVTGQPPLMKKD